MLRHGLGYKPDTYDHRDYDYEKSLAVPPEQAAIPDVVDLRDKCSPVRDQGQQGSCTGFATTALMEFYNPPLIFSPAFEYFEERVLEGTVSDCDAGAMIRDGLKVLFNIGACPEADDPYDPTTCGGPSPTAIAAASHKITVYHRIKPAGALRNLQIALSQGHPAVIGILVYEGFENTKDGFIPMPLPHEQPLGGHAVLVVGYHEDAKYPGGGFLIVKNSWGVDFGDRGYVYLPFAYVDAKLMSDIWVAY